MRKWPHDTRKARDMARLLHKPPTFSAVYATPPTSNATWATLPACTTTYAMPPARHELQPPGSSAGGRDYALLRPGLNRRPQSMSSQSQVSQIKGRALLASIDMIVPGCVVSDLPNQGRSSQIKPGQTRSSQAKSNQVKSTRLYWGALYWTCPRFSCGGHAGVRVSAHARECAHARLLACVRACIWACTCAYVCARMCAGVSWRLRAVRHQRAAHSTWSKGKPHLSAGARDATHMLPPSSAAALQSRVVIAGLYRHVETSRRGRVHAAYESGDHC